MNIILRPVFNRPEMLYLSIEYEKKARTFYDLGSLHTIFLVEYNSPKTTKRIVEDYPYSKTVIERPNRLGLSANILLGMKTSFKQADSYLIHLEDDVLLHYTYFDYMRVLLEQIDPSIYCILSPATKKDGNNVEKVFRSSSYQALAPLITKTFFTDYILPCIDSTYLKDKKQYISNLNDRYGHHEKYTKNNLAHYEQAGLINRLVDIAIIKEQKFAICPEINRQRHIGFYGKNRPNGSLPGTQFEERIKNLREIIKDTKTMFEYSGKVYNDYALFSGRLEEWKGKIDLA